MRALRAVCVILWVLVQATTVCLGTESSPGGRQVRFSVTPAATGEQLVRTSLPLPRGFLGTNETLVVKNGQWSGPAGVRVLSWHPATNAEPRTARRALVTFPYRFAELEPVAFTLEASTAKADPRAVVPAIVDVVGDVLQLDWSDGREMDIKILAPRRASSEPPEMETVENNECFAWGRGHLRDVHWPRVVECRTDRLGGITLVIHVQRANTNGVYAPELGLEITAKAKRVELRSGDAVKVATDKAVNHSFTEGLEATCRLDDWLEIYHPTAPLKRCGSIEITRGTNDSMTYRYLRCRAEDKVPMQPMSWQRIEVVLAPPGLAKLPPALTSPHSTSVEPALWSGLYGKCELLPSLPRPLRELVRYHRDAIVRSAAVGDDFGNVTGYSDRAQHGGVHGMNRLNHGAPIFLDGWRDAEPRLVETAVLWCDNFYDQSIWWGAAERGGTRYNNMARFAPAPDDRYMWRSDRSVSFCTKGYDCFWLAWEETGDPRMREAFEAQVDYAASHVHANRGECRNIGDVRDFIRLYRYTGEQKYLDNALRLFRELRTKLSTGHLFDQGGKPLDPDPPFIDEDKAGLKVGYAKPYIIGYALVGLPELLEYAPNEPDLKETIRAVANFLAQTVDPPGGWRYPHPQSSAVIISQGLEHAWQLTQAARALGPDPKWLDAIEIVLRARVLGWQKTGMIMSGLEGWEVSTGKVKNRMELYDLYRKPGDRDPSRDWRAGKISYGSSAPEGIVYFEEVLGYYLQHRPASRLLAEPKPDEPLGLILARSPERKK